MCNHKHANCAVHLFITHKQRPLQSAFHRWISGLIYILPSYLNGQIIGSNIRVLRSHVKSQAVCHLDALARKAVMFNDTLSHTFSLLMRCSSFCMDERECVLQGEGFHRNVCHYKAVTNMTFSWLVEEERIIILPINCLFSEFFFC